MNHKSVGSKKRSGAKKFYGAQELMNVWLYVQLGIKREKTNVHQFCGKGRKGRYVSWIMGGSGVPPRVLRNARGRTLWRRYQEAVAFLKSESETYRILWEMSGRS